jgi:hypothetical protein
MARFKRSSNLSASDHGFTIGEEMNRLNTAATALKLLRPIKNRYARNWFHLHLREQMTEVGSELRHSLSVVPSVRILTRRLPWVMRHKRKAGTR